MAEMTPADKMARVKERITAVIADITAEATRFGWTLTDTSAYRNLTEALALLDSLEATEGHTLRGRGNALPETP